MCSKPENWTIALVELVIPALRRDRAYREAKAEIEAETAKRIILTKTKEIARQAAKAG